MWYFSWLLGTLFACFLAIIVSLWFEYHENNPKGKDNQ